MYVVVDFNDNNKIVWHDTRVCDNVDSANSRMEFFKKKCPNKNYKIAQFTKFKLSS